MSVFLTVSGDDWILDAATRLDYSADSDSTDHPVEYNSSDAVSEITDNIDIKPLTISLEGIMSEVPIEGQNENIETFSEGRQWAFVEALLDARSQRSLVSLDAGDRGAWDNLVIESFNPSWSVENGSSVQSRLSLKQIEFVETKTTFGLSTSSNIEENVLQLFSGQVSQKTGVNEATPNQIALIQDALSFDGVDISTDVVAGR